MEEEILKLLKEGESLHLEFKETDKQLPRSLWETYSAFANTDGGTILLGVKENKDETELQKRFEISGVDNPEKLLSDFWNNINNEQIVNSNILMDRDVAIYEIDGSNIIRIDVPRASYKQKPIYLRNNPFSGTYLRNYEGDYHASKENVKAMFRDSSASGSDGELLEGYTFDDIDQATLEKYREEFKSTHPDHIWNSVDNLEFLKNIGGYAQNRRSKEWWLTAAGLLTFGKGYSIRDYFDTIDMDYLDQSDLLPGARWSNRMNFDGSWESNLYNYIKRVVPKLIDDLPRPFKLQGIKRVDSSPISLAIREAVINMVIHSDYHTDGTLEIIKRDNAFFFSNPGNLKLPLQEIFHGGFSRARNPRIQKIFELIGYGESIGSGFPTILQIWEEENWRLPDLKYNSARNQVELKLWMVPLLSKDLEEYLKELYSSSYDSLDEIKKIIILSALIEEEITKSRLKALLEIEGNRLEENLRWLVEEGYLKKILKNSVENVFIINDKKIESERTSDFKHSGQFRDENVKDRTKNLNIIKTPKSNESKPVFVESSIVDSNEEKIINYLRGHDFITSSKVIEITNLSTRQGANKLLNRLVEKGLLVKQKRGKIYIYSLK